MAAGTLLAQDIHFSQYGGSVLNVSPAFTGIFDGDWRAGAIYRSQWHSVPVNYSTFSMSGERRWRPVFLAKDLLGAGLRFNSDRAGDARYGTTQVYMSGSYIWLPRADSNLFISLGADAGWCQVGFDYSRMTFDNQYDGMSFNRSLGSGEQFPFVRKSFLDVNTGIAARYLFHRQLFSAGLSLHHITSPAISYQGNDLSKLDVKFSAYAAYNRPAAYNLDWQFELLASFQGKYYELMPHVSLLYYMSRVEGRGVSGGIVYRARDAIIPRVGYQKGTLRAGMAYDVNLSAFNAASNRRGAFEIFLNCVFRDKPSFKALRRNCPVFL